MTVLCVVVPAYNEATGLPAFHRELLVVMQAHDIEWTVLYVDDGSTDDTWEVVLALGREDSNVRGLRLSRNFGKEAATTAGLDACDADAVVLMDADLQDPPSLISCMLDKWREGFDVVYARRESRSGDSGMKRVTASLFYRVMGILGGRVRIPSDAGDFRLMSRRVVHAMRLLPERRRFMKGLFAWVGYPSTSVMFTRPPRVHGNTKWGYPALIGLALEGITSFSVGPLRLCSYAGAVAALLSFAYGLVLVVDTLVYGNPVPGYPSIIVCILFMGSLQLIALGILGEYVGRLFEEVKGRPIYLVQDTLSPCPMTEK